MTGCINKVNLIRMEGAVTLVGLVTRVSQTRDCCYILLGSHLNMDLQHCIVWGHLSKVLLPPPTFLAQLIAPANPAMQVGFSSSKIGT